LSKGFKGNDLESRNNLTTKEQKLDKGFDLLDKVEDLIYKFIKA
jgi:hypothetical protein